MKALGHQLGRFVLVFNCDEHFDFHAMGRIFVGLCQVGAWGCFDEFNRLEERILSAVSQQILAIQSGLMARAAEIEVIGKPVKLHPNVGIFVTLNPGYAGRSKLPDNLKTLFRSVAMIKPDWELIAQVMLFSQGFQSAESLASKVVLLFSICNDQLSAQPHYDFGLRALKSVLVSAGGLKRVSLSSSADDKSTDTASDELGVLLRSVTDTVLPKLVAADVSLFETLVQGVFPGVELAPLREEMLVASLKSIAAERNLKATDTWLRKALQLYKIQHLHHGVMLVGPSGTGKTAVRECVLTAMTHLDDVKGETHRMDPKALSKSELYGELDPATLEWTDGVFTALLRQIVNNVR